MNKIKSLALIASVFMTVSFSSCANKPQPKNFIPQNSTKAAISDTKNSQPNTSKEENINVQSLQQKETTNNVQKYNASRIGDRNNNVKTIQKLLNKFGYNLSVDGSFGYKTLSAVKDFQKKNNLSVDGIVGPKTLSKLNLSPTKLTTYKTVIKTKVTSKPKTTYKAISSNNLEAFVNNSKFSSATNYFIWVNTSTNHVCVFTGSKENWKLNRDILCSTGKSSTPTKKGLFTVKDKGYSFRVSKSVICKYWTRITGNYLFHSVLLNNKGNVVDGRLGLNISHGCVRLAVENAKWIQNNIPASTSVYIN